MNKKWTIIGALVATLFIWHPAQSGDNDLINMKPLLKDSVASNPGLESITPLINMNDTDSNGVSDRVALAFNVWAAGTNTWLFKTEKRVVDLPTLPCINPDLTSIDVEDVIKYTNETGGRVNMIFAINVYCEEASTGEGKDAYKTIVYSADVTKSPGEGGNSWVKYWGKEALSFNLVDWDEDEQKEVIVGLLVDRDTSTDTRVMIFDQSDGTKEADNKYRIANEF